MLHTRAFDRAGVLFVAVSAVCFGTLAIFGKLAARQGIPLPLLLGLRFPTGSRFNPYVELRPEIGGGNRLVLTTGILF